MARIRITDLPKDMKVSEKELRQIRAGAAYIQAPSSGFTVARLGGSRLVDATHPRLLLPDLPSITVDGE